MAIKRCCRGRIAMLLAGTSHRLLASALVQRHQPVLLHSCMQSAITRRAIFASTVASSSTVPIASRRGKELDWLWTTTQHRIPRDLLPRLVAHRGFHNANDEADTRPLENTLAAYEQAWASGIRLCECDVAATRDDRLVLCHDGDYDRLALPTMRSVSRRSAPVRELELCEVMALTLTSGQRPPLLEEVLQSATHIGGAAQLVVELKRGYRSAPRLLLRLFDERPELLDRVAVFMSFDRAIVRDLQRRLAARAWHGARPEVLLLTVDPRLAPHDHDANVFDISAAAAKPPDEQAKQLLTANEAPDGLRKVVPALDGLYVQFQPEMLLPSGAEAMRRLTSTYTVGVWGYVPHDDPDDVETATWMVRECGVSFVNTDLPRSFAR